MQEVAETTTTAVYTAERAGNNHSAWVLLIGVILLFVLIYALRDWFAPKTPLHNCSYCGDGTDGREIRCTRVENRGKTYVVENEQTVATYCPVCGRKLGGDE